MSNRRTAVAKCMLEIGANTDQPNSPNIFWMGITQRQKKIYEFFGCFFHGHKFQTFRDINTVFSIL